MMLAAGFMCECGHELADVLKMRMHEGDMALLLRCQLCGRQWRDLVKLNHDEGFGAADDRRTH